MWWWTNTTLRFKKKSPDLSTKYLFLNDGREVDVVIWRIRKKIRDEAATTTAIKKRSSMTVIKMAAKWLERELLIGDIKRFEMFKESVRDVFIVQRISGFCKKKKNDGTQMLDVSDWTRRGNNIREKLTWTLRQSQCNWIETFWHC